MFKAILRYSLICMFACLTAPFPTQAQNTPAPYSVDTTIRTEQFGRYFKTPGNAQTYTYVAEDGWYSFVVPASTVHTLTETGSASFRFDEMLILIKTTRASRYAHFTPAQLDGAAEAETAETSESYRAAANNGRVVRASLLPLKAPRNTMAPKAAVIDFISEVNNRSYERVVATLFSNRGLVTFACHGSHERCRALLSGALSLGYGAYVPSDHPVKLNDTGGLIPPDSHSFQAPEGAGNIDVRPAPASSRGRETPVSGQSGTRIWTSENGWYTVRLGPQDFTEISDGLRFFTYIYPEGRADVYVLTETLTEGVDFTLAQDNIEIMLDPANNAAPPIVTKVPSDVRYVMELTPSASGKKAGKLATWIGNAAPDDKSHSVATATYTPHGVLVVLSAGDSREVAERAIRENFRFAEGLFETPQ